MVELTDRLRAVRRRRDTKDGISEAQRHGEGSTYGVQPSPEPGW